jgi:hypothetical protein
MRKLILAMAAVAALGWAGGAMAQSQQGGYLGQNPSGQQTATTSVARPADIGSRQGGYLGQNPGANLAPAKLPAGDMKSSAGAWCAKSTEPSRCRGSAEMNHKLCLDASNYDACRTAYDRMYSK